MSESTKNVLTGGCYCGSIRYRLKGNPAKVAFCHCESCRKISGAPVTVAVMGSQQQFEFTNGEPRYYQSSVNAQRGFCDTCGTPVSWLGRWHGNAQMFVYAGTLDDINAIKPDRHAFTDYCVSWLIVNPELPDFEQSSPEGTFDTDNRQQW